MHQAMRNPSRERLRAELFQLRHTAKELEAELDAAKRRQIARLTSGNTNTDSRMELVKRNAAERENRLLRATIAHYVEMTDAITRAITAYDSPELDHSLNYHELSLHDDIGFRFGLLVEEVDHAYSFLNLACGDKRQQIPFVTKSTSRRLDGREAVAVNGRECRIIPFGLEQCRAAYWQAVETINSHQVVQKYSDDRNAIVGRARGVYNGTTLVYSFMTKRFDEADRMAVIFRAVICEGDSEKNYVEITGWTSMERVIDNSGSEVTCKASFYEWVPRKQDGAAWENPHLVSNVITRTHQEVTYLEEVMENLLIDGCMIDSKSQIRSI